MDLSEEDKIKHARAVHKYTDEILQDRRRITNRHRLARIVLYPACFIIVNGSFFIILWFTGLGEQIKQTEGFYETIWLYVISALYLGYIYLCGKIVLWITDKMGIPWLFGRE
jgi:hypothetical protein